MTALTNDNGHDGGDRQAVPRWRPVSECMQQAKQKPNSIAGFLVLVIGLAGAGATFYGLSERTINPVTYQFTELQVPGDADALVGGRARSLVIPLFSLALIAVLAWRRSEPARDASTIPRGGEPAPAHAKDVGTAALPLVGSAVAGILLLALGRGNEGGLPGWMPDGLGEQIGEAVPFVLFCVVAIGVGWTVARLGENPHMPAWIHRADRVAPALLVAAIVASTVYHAAGQYMFWKHFLLGYADFGFFTTELEHCLPFKDVGPVRFDDTRMGYHAVFMFYVLVPFYAVFRTPVFLMVVGPLVLNLAAIPFYQLARDRSGSAAIGLVVALAYLALPSLARLPYSNSYGFQSIYLAAPWLAFAFTLAMRGRWKWSHLCLAGAMLCEETVCGVALGWGVYLCLFGGRRRDGLIISFASIAYLLICTTLVIPAFASASTYTRLMLFGNLDVATAVERLTRPRVLLFLLALGAPLALGLLRRLSLLIVILPTLVLVVLLQQTDYLNLKYWHHTSILIGLFTAAALGVTSGNGNAEMHPGPPPRLPGHALGLLVTVLIFHQFLGYSPLSQSQRIYAATPALNQPDPRLAAVEFVRDNFPPPRYAVIATERMAAHFTDYRMVHPAPGARLADTAGSPHIIVVDRSDGWDGLIMHNQSREFLDRAREAGYVPVHELGPVVLLTRAE